MDNNFVPSVLNLRNANSDEIINKLHSIFSTITQMNADEVVVAYQTVDATAEAAGLSSDAAIIRILDALSNQMINLQNKTSKVGFLTSLEDPYRRDRFEAVRRSRIMRTPLSSLLRQR
jgi:hypothetical protein